MRSGVELRIERDAVLLGSADGNDFPELETTFWRTEYAPRFNKRCFIYAEGCEDIAFEPLWPMYRYMLMRQDHPLAGQESAPLSAFGGERLILPEDPYLRTSVLIPRRDMQRAGIDITLTSSSFEGSVIMVQAGMGIVMIEAAPQTRFPGLSAVRIEDYPLIKLGIAWRRDAETPQIRAWLDVMRKERGEVQSNE